MSNLIRINNKNNFIIKDHPTYHPATSDYLKYWREQKRRIIEGYWAPDDTDVSGYSVIDNSYDVDSEKWRYMPPQLYFYINHSTILHNPENEGKAIAKKKMRPYLRDIDWMFFYAYFEARGFSGFSDDNKYTCNREVERYENKEKDYELDYTCYRKDGKIKKYISARDYLKKLHKKPLGKPLYMNEAKNLMVLGSRGGGKSYWLASILLHEVITDAAKEYSHKTIENPSRAEVAIGAAIAAKSSDTLSKLLLTYRDLPGTWMKDTEYEIPSPLHKEMAGTLQPNNSSSPWRHEYEKKVNGKWRKFGTGSNIKHYVYSIENPEAAAGGRFSLSVIDEVGLVPNLLTITGSNQATLYEGAVQFGSAVYAGTAGNMEKIVESEIIFRDPESFNFLSFENEWELNSKPIGFFIPAQLSINKFKDENGNTDEDAALRFLENRREKKKRARTNSAYLLELLSYPIKPSEMFVKNSGSIFPVADLREILADVENSDIILDSSWKGHFIMNQDGEVEYRNSALNVIRNYPILNTDSMEGPWEIFEMPKKNREGEIEYGRYIAGWDPVEDDGNDNHMNSLQSLFILDTFTDRLVAEYTSRTQIAEEFYEQARRGLIFYNAKVNYENKNKGVYAYFKNMKSLHLLKETPEILQDKEMIRINRVGNKSYGTSPTENVNAWGRRLINSWLLKPATGDDEDVMNMHKIRSVGLLKELIMWNGELNADRVSALGMLMIYREDVLEYINQPKEEIKVVGDETFWDNSMHYYYSRGVKKRNAIRTMQNILYN